MLLRRLGWRERKRDDHTLSNAHALVKTDSESIEAGCADEGYCSRLSWHAWERSAYRGGDVGEVAGGKGCSFGQENDWMGRLEEDLKEFGVKSEGWHEAAQKAGRWFRRIEDGAEAYTRRWHDAEKKSNAAKRHATVAAATRTVGTNARKWRGEEEGALWPRD